VIFDIYVFHIHPLHRLTHPSLSSHGIFEACPWNKVCQKTQSGSLVICSKKIHQWIYSWMKPGYVEDEMEYKISKFLLMQFICSAAVLIAAEGQTHMIVKILRFLRGYVFDKEHTYLYYLRKLILTMFTGHSSAHEVMNLL